MRVQLGGSGSGTEWGGSWGEGINVSYGASSSVTVPEPAKMS